MTDISNKSPNGEVGATNENPEGQAQSMPQEQVVPEAQYKSLESEYTRNRQELIDAKAALCENNPKQILDIADEKLRNAVIRKNYGLENLAELKAVYGEEFYQSTKSADEVDELDKVKMELNKLKFNSQRGEIKQEILNLKSTNPELFASPDAEEQLLESMEMLSKDLPIKDRVQKAAKLAFGTVNKPNPYEALANMDVKVKGTGNSGGGEQKQNGEIQKRQDELRAFLGLKK